QTLFIRLLVAKAFSSAGDITGGSRRASSCAALATSFGTQVGIRSRGARGASAFMFVLVCLGGSVIGQCNEMSLSVNEAQELSAYLSEVFGCDNVLTRPRRHSSRTRPLASTTGAP